MKESKQLVRHGSPANSRLIRSLAATAGSLAAAAVSSEAATVEIRINTSSGIGTIGALEADLTGDGFNDLSVLSVTQAHANSFWVKIGNPLNAVDGKVGGTRMIDYIPPYYSGSAPPATDRFFARAKFAAAGTGVSVILGSGSVEATYLNAISFQDTRISSNPVQGYLEVRTTSDPSAFTVTFVRLVFDDAGATLPLSDVSIEKSYGLWSPVPELSNGLFGLALGAAGILRRRRESRAA